jgi:hypothetical protein
VALAVILAACLFSSSDSWRLESSRDFLRHGLLQSGRRVLQAQESYLRIIERLRRRGSFGVALLLALRPELPREAM